MLNKVDEYINRCNDEKKEWLLAFVTYMRNNHPNIEEKISYQMPLYKFADCYIAFSVAKEHFSFHTLDFEIIKELQNFLPKANFGKGCAKVKYSDKEAMPILYSYCDKIIKKHNKND